MGLLQSTEMSFHTGLDFACLSAAPLQTIMPWSPLGLRYGTERGTMFYGLQNSWGTDWGSIYYFNMKRGSHLAGSEGLAVL